MKDRITKKENKPPRVFKTVIMTTYKENFAYRSQMAVSIFSQPVYFWSIILYGERSTKAGTRFRDLVLIR